MRALYFLVGLFAASAVAADPVKTFRDCATCPEMVVIPAGSFVMGTPDSTRSAPNDSSNDKEKPARTIQMKSFSLGKYTTTATKSPHWMPMPGLVRIQTRKRIRLDRKNPIALVFTTCMAMCGNGRRIAGIRITKVRPKPKQHGKKAIASPALIGVVPGSTWPVC